MKCTVVDFALFGGRPEFQEPLHVDRPNPRDRQSLLQKMNDLLDRRWLSNGGLYVRKLEQRVANYLGVRHCVATCNGTTALDLAIRALFTKFSLEHDYNYAYVDFDACIIVNGSVNTDDNKFLYQGRNAETIILLSRHKFSIQESLRKFAISELLFD